MPHNFELSIQTLTKIDLLLPRLKHSVFSNQIISWLQNFDEGEVEMAIQLLSVYEYIPFDEFMLRLNDQLHAILKNHPVGSKILIYPYGKVGKSGTLVTYPLRNTKIFKKRKNDIEITHDLKNLSQSSQFAAIVFVDDFIGSGDTFVKEYSNNEIQNWISNNNVKDIYILAAIIMDEGKATILKKHPDIKIAAEVRHKIFDTKMSPLSTFADIAKIKGVSDKYGNTIIVFGPPTYYAPEGYSKSQSLISFFHGTPNNTLPIIWGGNKTWKPLFPRDSKIRMDQAREFKKEIAFYIGICNMLGIDIFTGSSILKTKNDRIVRTRTHNTKQDHSVVALLVLKNRGFEDIVICHILGLTMKELDIIYRESSLMKLTNQYKKLTSKGRQFLEELKAKTRKENFREMKADNLSEKGYIYLPKTFGGL